MQDVTNAVNSITHGMSKNGVANYLILFICCMFVFSNYTLTNKIDMMLTRLDKIIDANNAISKNLEVSNETNIKVNDITKKIDYIILRINKDDQYIKEFLK